jgi:hypothetical protein
VFASDGPEHEAVVFELVNRKRTTMTHGEIFRALLAGHDPQAWRVKHAVEEVGYSLHLPQDDAAAGKAARSNPQQLVCFASLLRLERHATLGVESIKFALTMAKQAWPDSYDGTHNGMIVGLAMYFVQKEGLVNAERFARQLGSVTPHKILSAAREANLSNNLAEAVVTQLVKKIEKKRVKRA